jgi:hypothetical protein
MIQPWLSSVSTSGTKWVILVTKDFRLIVTPWSVKMSQKPSTQPARMPAANLVSDVRHATRKHYSAEEKISIVLEGCHEEEGIENIEK